MKHSQVAAAIFLAGVFSTHAIAQETSEVIKPKVMVISMFENEAEPWLEEMDVAERVAVPGLFSEFPEVACTEEGLCHFTTGMGYANAASSVSAVIYDDRLDLTETYFVIAGIAGVDPSDGTLGSAHWARYVIDAGLMHEIDARKIPDGWTTGHFGLGANKPGVEPGWRAGTEVFRLNEALVQKAFELSRDTELLDGEKAADYRSAYPAPGNGAPFVSICDTLSSDTYWHGEMIAKAMNEWVSILTDGKGNYCTTQMEDNATLTALTRGDQAGLVDFDRVAVLRTGSNFDRQAPGSTPIESLQAESGGFSLATTNAYRVGSRLVNAVLEDWDSWKGGVPQL